MNMTKPLFAMIAGSALLIGCGDPTPPEPPTGPAAEIDAEAPPPPPDPVTAFMSRIAQHCGQSFEGRIINNIPPEGEAPPAEDPFVGQRLVMHVRECSDQELRIPFHVGDDHSRTWILTRTDTGLRLKHDHRHDDGTEDAVTMYGGTSTTPGSEVRQEFPVGQYSIDLFEREGLPASVTNTWAMEIEPGQRFLYELARPTGRLFQVEFDLTMLVDNPPTPWGHPPLPGDADYEDNDD